MDLNTGFAEKQATEATITATPNPTKGRFTISGVKNKFSCRVYNVQGRFVMALTEVMPGEFINLEALPDGIYLLSISAKADKQNQTIKIIKY
jgi:nitrogen fixation protein FixH